MEWITEYWYIVLIGLFAVMFVFGYRSNRCQEGITEEHGKGTHTPEKTHKSGHGCCH